MNVLFLLAASLSTEAPSLPMPVRDLDVLQVRALGLPGSATFDLPVTATVQPIASVPTASMVDMADAFDGIPGVLARDRYNRAQDLQLSIRGYGARSTFGVRGIRILADGLPVSAPDGQGQLTAFTLLGLDRVEVVRGPFAALQGNASGGVVQLITRASEARGPWWLQTQIGSHGEYSAAALMQGGTGEQWAYSLLPMAWQADGARSHSRAQRRSVGLRLDRDQGQDGRLSVFAQHFDAPDAQDPRSLTLSEWRDDPWQAAPVALAYNTRKSVRQDQLGAVWDKGNVFLSTRLSAHLGRRAVVQYLAIPAAVQANPLHGGGVVDLDSDYAGWEWRIAGKPAPAWEWSAGISSEGQWQHRRGWESTDGSLLGVRGRLRRDQDDTVWNLDAQAQLVWSPLAQWQLQAGARHSRVQFHSRDRYITVTNPDDSGRTAYHRSTPVVGATFSPTDDWRWHVAVGRGLETPTFNELAYRADGEAGLALDLQAALSTQWETGWRWRNGASTQMGLTLFGSRTQNELAIAGNAGGRSSYRNVGRTRRQGWEVSGQWNMPADWQGLVAWTRLEAEVRACAAIDCAGLVPGNRLPGTVRDQLQLQLIRDKGPWRLQIAGTALSAMSANDAGTAWAPGHALLDTALVRQWPQQGGPVTLTLAVDNLMDRRYVASVAVNDGNGRFFEPGAGRTFRLGIRWAFDMNPMR